ncbi:MAG TPA: (2Fe-2S) ferredoxin domain-containing protein, partial [Thermodesulfobacteriota bacterium]
MRFSNTGELEEYRKGLARGKKTHRHCLRICMTGCRAYGAMEVKDALTQQVKMAGLEEEVEIRQTGCQGFCARAPVMVLDPDDIFYQQVTPEDAPDIVSRTLAEGKLVER